MATYIIALFVLLLAKFQSITPMEVPRDDGDLSVAIEEMQKANYFAFVMLINMFRRDRKFQGNVTFLMPNDRMLSKTTIPESEVSSFLYRHSIPSPLLFEKLQYIPTGSIIPTSSEPEYMLGVSNGCGRRSFFLNNVKIISPNICTARFSIRCHGIDGVLSASKSFPVARNTPLPTCSNSTASVASTSSASPAAAPPPFRFLPPLPDGSLKAPSPQPPSDSSQQNDSSRASQFLSVSKWLKLAGPLLVISIIGVLI